jgi:4-hydroxy-3-methylbut-2-en-1-yl diphosphate reductase
MGRVMLAAPRGYCAGVERAIVTVEEALRRYGAPVYVRKQIVHNTFVVGDLTRRGAVFVDELDEVPDDALVIFSAHGVSPAVKEQARERGLRTIDATCPLVTKVHKEAVRFAEVGYEIVLIGHADHEEVEGTLGEAPEHMHVVDPARPDDLHLPDDTPVSWLSQTTLSVDETMTAVRRLRERFPGLVDPPSDDICYASQNRQEAVARIAPHCDLVVVVGSSNSSNSQRLVEVALGAGARASYLVDRAADADERWLDGVETVGVSSGASVPDHLVGELLDWLAARGYADTESVTLAEETLTFSLPQELR